MTGGDDDLVGSVIGGRYRVEAPLANGTFSRLYLARHHELGRRFAIKILDGGACDSALRVRFTQEARAAAKLFHPNVVSTCDFGRTDRGELYLVMDYVGERTLLDVIVEEAPLHPRRVLDLTRGICRGLAHIHAHGLIHRDLKPANVVIDCDGRPRIVDFGLAISPQGGDCGARVTRHGLVVGTPHYVSPEQAFGQPLDPRTDLFSLGIVVYEMLVGRLPFDATTSQIAQQNASSIPPRMTELNPRLRIPAEVERLVDQLLKKRRERRCPDARAVIEELDRIERHWQAPTSPAIPAASPRARLRRKLAWGLLVAAIGSAGLVGLPWTLGGSSDTGGSADVSPDAPGALRPASAKTARRVRANDAAPAGGARTAAASTWLEAQTGRTTGGEAEFVEELGGDKSSKSSSAPAARVARLSAARLARRYRAVGSGIASLGGRFGDGAIEDLRRDFFALPYAEALRSRPTRKSMFSALADIARDLERREQLLKARAAPREEPPNRDASVRYRSSAANSSRWQRRATK